MKLVSETIWYTKKEPAAPTRRPLVTAWNKLFNGWFVSDSMRPWSRIGNWSPPKKLVVQVWEEE
jgi:hypothetical protein